MRAPSREEDVFEEWEQLEGGNGVDLLNTYLNMSYSDSML